MVLGRVSEILCSLLQETLPHTILPKTIEAALAKGIYAHVNQCLGYMWIPEDSK